MLAALLLNLRAPQEESLRPGKKRTDEELQHVREHYDAILEARARDTVPTAQPVVISPPPVVAPPVPVPMPVVQPAPRVARPSVRQATPAALKKALPVRVQAPALKTYEVTDQDLIELLLAAEE